MSDELKPCPFCKSGAHTFNGLLWHVACDGCGCRLTGFVTEANAIAAWNTRADEPQVIENAENYKLADDSKPQVITNGEKYELADSRERLEADVRESYEAGMPIKAKVLDWLDRQAAITTHEVSDGYEHVAERQSDRIFELHNKLADALGRVDRLTAERDELKAELAKCEHDCGLLFDENDKLTAERDELSNAVDKLRRRVDGLFCLNDLTDKHVAELEAENKRLRDSEACVGCEDVTRQISELTAERDNWANCYDMAVKREQSLLSKIDELTAELKNKQRVCDIQRDSFLKLERENRELQDVCGELERTLENMRRVVE